MLQYIQFYLPTFESFFVILGVIFIAIQIWQQTRFSRANHDRQKKQSTIEFCNLIFHGGSQAFLHDIMGQYLGFSSVNLNKVLRESIVSHLSRLENLAVGIASDVYDFEILCLMSGRHLSEIYYHLQKYIEEARVAKNAPMLYKELELLVVKIDNYRKDNPNKTVDNTVRVYGSYKQ